MASKTRFWNAVLVLLSALNVGAVWFAAGDPPWHATIHAALALTFGLWAQRRMRLEEARSSAGALESGREADTEDLRDEVGDVRRELGEVQERLDFAERLLSQAREVSRRPGRPEP